MSDTAGADRKVKAPGNVAQFVAWIAEETEGELFSIQVLEPYPSDWDGV